MFRKSSNLLKGLQEAGKQARRVFSNTPAAPQRALTARTVGLPPQNLFNAAVTQQRWDHHDAYPCPSQEVTTRTAPRNGVKKAEAPDLSPWARVFARAGFRPEVEGLSDDRLVVCTTPLEVALPLPSFLSVKNFQGSLSSLELAQLIQNLKAKGLKPHITTTHNNHEKGDSYLTVALTEFDSFSERLSKKRPEERDRMHTRTLASLRREAAMTVVAEALFACCAHKFSEVVFVKSCLLNVQMRAKTSKRGEQNVPPSGAFASALIPTKQPENPRRHYFTQAGDPTPPRFMVAPGENVNEVMFWIQSQTPVDEKGALQDTDILRDFKGKLSEVPGVDVHDRFQQVSVALGHGPNKAVTYRKGQTGLVIEFDDSWLKDDKKSLDVERVKNVFHMLPFKGPKAFLPVISSQHVSEVPTVSLSKETDNFFELTAWPVEKVANNQSTIKP